MPILKGPRGLKEKGLIYCDDLKRGPQGIKKGFVYFANRFNDISMRMGPMEEPWALVSWAAEFGAAIEKAAGINVQVLLGISLARCLKTEVPAMIIIPGAWRGTDYGVNYLCKRGKTLLNDSRPPANK